MESIKTVGIQSLKKNLSTYLKEVRSGTRILITDHDEWIAELREPDLSVEHMMATPTVVPDDDSIQLFRSLSREARQALLMELEKI